MKCLITIALLATAILSPPALAYCDNHGGNVMDCFENHRLDRPGPVSGHHASGDVIALKRATCVAADSTWLFHSARDAHGTRFSPGNTIILATFNHRFPRLAEHLAHDVFGPGVEEELTGAELARFGVPTCKGE